MRPRHDPIPRVAAGAGRVRRGSLARLADAICRAADGRRDTRRRPDREAGGEPCPVVPDRPLDLSGGGAAPLLFDD